MIRKAFSVLNKNEKRFFFILLFLILINAVFEMVGIAAIIPLINLILQEQFLTNFPYIRDFLLQLSQIVLPTSYYESNNIKNNLIVGGAFIFLVFFLFKTLFYIFLSYCSNTFSRNLNYSISTKLFKGYLKLDYAFHSTRNSSNLRQTIIQETAGFTSLFNNIIIMLTEGIIVLFVTIFLLVYSFSTSFFVFLFLSIVALTIIKVTRSRISFWGSQRLKFMEKRFKLLQESLDSIKEIYILQKSLFFFNNFENFSGKFLTSQRNSNFTQNITKPILEFLGILGLFTLLIVLIFQGQSIVNLISIIGLFLIASIRLLPSVNKIVSSLQGVKYFKASLDRIADECEVIEKNLKLSNSIDKLGFSKDIVFNNVTFSYPNNNKLILKNLNFSIEKNSIFGIKGASGKGKTTLLNLILTLFSPSIGEVQIDGKKLSKNNLNWLKNIGYVSQSTNLMDDTVERNIAFGLYDNQIEKNKVDKAIQMAQLSNFIKSLKDGVKTRVGERGQLVSGGQMQRIGIARSLYNNPDILILDEPTSSLDLETEEIFMDTIYQLKNKTIIIVSHRESILNKCKKVLDITNGKIFKLQN